jgi:CubicO group peptidase (beta-lactamase class C family)
MLKAMKESIQTYPAGPPLVFPDAEWERKSPAEAGFDEEKWKEWVGSISLEGHSSWGQNPEKKYGMVITRNGYLVAEFGDPNMKTIQSASVGKAFAGLAIQLLIDKGKLKSADDPIHEYWSGEEELSHPYKYMNNDRHKNITFRKLDKMCGGFPISNGWKWSNCEDVPNWAECSGDPTKDNFSHHELNRRHYSSGGRWRLHQALTQIMGTTLKDFLDKELFSKIGIKAENWWIESGKVLYENQDWYPDMPGYGLFCDPPYYIAGHEVQGGGGWVYMSPKDLARIALLVANRGVWKGERLISDTDFLYSHDGGNGSSMWGHSYSKIACGQVTTSGIRNAKNLSETVLYVSRANLQVLLK